MTAAMGDGQGTTLTSEGTLVEFAQGVRWAALPGEVRQAVTTLVADALGNAVAGRTAADLPQLRAAGRELYGCGTSTVIAGPPASIVDAAGLNAFLITANTMCDVYRPGLCHVTPEVVPAALAAGEHAGRSGTELLEAITAGLEITTRICQAINYPAFRARGWHSPGIAGTIGASVTAGRLLGLGPQAMLGCLGLAGAQAAGSFADAGTIGVKFHQMNGARAAVVAALHASHGLLGSRQPLTARDGGLLRAFSDGPDPSRLTERLGDRWELLQIATRAYPAASTLQSLISCLLDPDDGRSFEAEEIEGVTIDLPDEAYRLGAHAGWESELRAMQSARFVAAAVMITGGCWTDLYRAANRADPRITDFAADRVSVRHDPALADGAVRVRLTTRVGVRELGRTVPVGDPRLPMTDAQVSAKLARCLDGAPVPLAAADGSGVARLLHLDAEPDVRVLLRELAETNRGYAR